MKCRSVVLSCSSSCSAFAFLRDCPGGNGPDPTYHSVRIHQFIRQCHPPCGLSATCNGIPLQGSWFNSAVICIRHEAAHDASVNNTRDPWWPSRAQPRGSAIIYYHPSSVTRETAIRQNTVHAACIYRRLSLITPLRRLWYEADIRGLLSVMSRLHLYDSISTSSL